MMLMKTTMVAAMLSLAGLPAAAVAGEPADDRVVVATADGRLEGEAGVGFEAFRGIPFAKPPVGELRWRAPQPVQPWQGVRPATQLAAACMQEPMPGIAAPLAAPLSEDCLYLNVWRPAGARAGTRLPVMVWIHGGGFVNGGTSADVFRGEAFARRGVILVSIAYRLGRFGFFAHPALTAAKADGGMLANYGYMDQIAALRWIRRNIARFGGDPGNVTLYGESAGGRSVQTMMVSPLAKGLFAKAIIASGGGRPNVMGSLRVSQDEPGNPSLEARGLAFARQHGVEGADGMTLARLRALPAEAVTGGLNMITSFRQPATWGGPAIDGRLLPDEPSRLFEAGRQARVPVLVGATDRDLSVLFGRKDQVFARFGANAGALRRHYDPDGNGREVDVMAAMGGDLAMVEPARFLARAVRSAGAPAWSYRFSYVATAKRAANPNGAVHASDVPYAMGTVRLRYGAETSREDESVADAMNGYWANFARRGDPNGPGLPHWPAYDTNSDVILNFAADGLPRAGADPRRERLDLLVP